MADWKWLGTVGKWLGTAAEKAKEYEPLIKTGIAATSTYAAFKDQQKKNEMQQAAYDDYMAQAEAAGHEAAAAVDLNLTPMTVSGVPTTKADVTDFTAVAAKGGLMSIPNKQRKRYARGPEEVDVMEFDEETITPFGLQQETGIDLTGEQVKYNTGNPRQDAWGVWNSGGINQEIYEFDFEIFFDSGDWMDFLKGEAPATGNMQMASHAGNDAFLENRYQELLEMNLSPAEAAAQAEKELSSGNVPGPMATGGIAGLRHGGRPGYAEDGFVTADVEEVVSEVSPSRVQQIEGNQMADAAYNEIFRKFYERFPNIDTEDMTIADMVALLQAEGVMEIEDLGILGLDRSLDMITPQSAERSAQRMAMGDTQWGDIPMAKGGRPGYRLGDEVVEDRETMAQSITLPDGGEEVVTDSMTEIEGQTASSVGAWARSMNGGRGPITRKDYIDIYLFLGYDEGTAGSLGTSHYKSGIGQDHNTQGLAQGGRIKKDNGGIMNLGGLEKDYRTTGGFVPIGAYEKKDDVPARLSKNEFVMTADAVRAAGGGSINKGAQRMYDTMKHLEAQPQAKRMTA